MKPETSSQYADEQENRLWIASQRYMLGEINIEELEEEERPHALNLRKAEIALAKMKPETTSRTADEQEDRLWMASRLYMLGEISIAELEDVERPHALNFHKSLVALAKWRVKWHLHLKWGFLNFLKGSREDRQD